MAAWPRRPAAAGGGASSGGAAAEERGLGLAVWLVVVGVVRGRALYSRGKAVGGGVAVRSAGERCGRS